MGPHVNEFSTRSGFGVVTHERTAMRSIPPSCTPVGQVVRARDEEDRDDAAEEEEVRLPAMWSGIWCSTATSSRSPGVSTSSRRNSVESTT